MTDRRATRITAAGIAAAAMSAARYPLTRQSMVVGALLATLVGTATNNLIVGYAVFVLCAAIGLTWRRNEAPVFPFIVSLQWIQVSSGYFFEIFTGVMPTRVPVGDIDRTVEIALTGLLVLAAGIRIVDEIWPSDDTAEPPIYVHNLTGLFFLVVAEYSINYVSSLNTSIYSSFNVILERVLLVRQIPLLLLWFEVLRQRRHKLYLWLSLIWVFVPVLGAYLSDFKTPLFLALIVSASTWKPWEGRAWQFTISGTTRTVAIAAAVLFMAMTWQAGVKGETRKVYEENEMGASPRERVEFFLDSAARAVPTVFQETEYVVEGLISRVWYVVLFSRVLEYTPAVEPHAHGELLGLAVSNAVTPRFLFPDKPPLPPDTYYTHRFAGVESVNDAETSISIGYMAEFYSDWGLLGMFVSIFFYGALMGGVAGAIRRFVQPRLLLNPALITVLLTVSFFESQFIKMFGALLMAAILTLTIVWLSRRRFAQFLDLRPWPGSASTAVAHSLAFNGTRMRPRGDARTFRQPGA